MKAGSIIVRLSTASGIALLASLSGHACGGTLGSQENWRLAHFGFPVNRGIAGNHEDPDHDGLVNLLEYAFGLDPLIPGTAGKPEWVKVGGNLVCEFDQAPDSDGITCGAEWSHSLQSGDWHPVDDTGVPPHHVFSVPVGSTDARFVRLKITGADTPEFADIYAGAFQMGDQSSPASGNPDGRELPVHAVELSAFRIKRHEVTLEEWEEIRAWGAGHGYPDLPPGNGAYPTKGAHHPVHSVTWHEAVKWCNARSEMENLTPCYSTGGGTYRTGVSSPLCDWNADGYRLPTEAEWEMAARGGSVGRMFPWGSDTISHNEANYAATSKDGLSNEFAYDLTVRPPGVKLYYHPEYALNNFPYSSTVGSFPANGYGIHDMAGNMLEWCWDWLGPYAAGLQTNPRGPGTGIYRVCRGGAWGISAMTCRTSDRSYRGPEARDNGIGFRTVRRTPP